MGLEARSVPHRQVVCEYLLRTIIDTGKRITNRDMDQMLTPESSLPDKRAAPSSVKRKTLTWR